jgi:hypothetical protein
LNPSEFLFPGLPFSGGIYKNIPGGKNSNDHGSNMDYSMSCRKQQFTTEKLIKFLEQKNIPRPIGAQRHARKILLKRG